MTTATLLLFVNLTHAVVAGPVGKVTTMLVEEVQKRTGVQWTLAGAGANIVITQGSGGPAEGYTIRVEHAPPRPGGVAARPGGVAAGDVVRVTGNDARGVLFGVGRLLRAMRMTEGSVTLDDNFAVTSAPKYAIRGHQLGYRPKTNSYDGWSLPVWEQYIRDLAVFGTNAIELIPPRSDDAATSPHFPLPPMEMMIGMSKLIDDYGLDCWIWYPAMDPDYTKPEQVRAAVDEWAEVLRKLPRVDAVFVPGGDPGHTEPRVLMALLAEQAKSLHRYHPKAQMWMSPQGFNAEWMAQFIDILKREQPDWLTGVVYGPQVRGTIQGLRASVPRRYAIRHYPDITHSRQSQYPVPEWDTAYAITEGREGINPRPTSEAGTFRATQPDSAGFITYSEGCNDDVNKIVWSSLGWDPSVSLETVLDEYSRYFIGEKPAPEFARGLFDLEHNWQGKLLANSGVESTLARFQALEKQASPRDLANWRFQQALYRAYYDAYIRRRLIFETEQESKAMDALRAGKSAEAVEILDRPFSDPARARVFELGEALFKSIKMQLSVKLYQAISVDRGANLDTIDQPLNSRAWIKAQIAAGNVDELLHRTDPGPGGFYDDLGVIDRQPHLLPGAYMGFTYNAAWPMAWWNHAGTLWEAPLRMRYTGLDAKAKYRVRVVYAGDSPRVKMRLDASAAADAGAAIEIHGYIDKPSPMRPLEFDLPPAAYASGELVLTWRVPPGQGGNGRGNTVAEIWLIRQ